MTKYAHMCRSDHIEIGFSENVHDADELNCPICLLLYEHEEALTAAAASARALAIEECASLIDFEVRYLRDCAQESSDKDDHIGAKRLDMRANGAERCADLLRALSALSPQRAAGSEAT